MSTEPNRFVVLDDTDPRIKYEGSDWKLTTAGTSDAWGIFGPTYNHTLQETWRDGSLSFRVNATKIYIYGTIDTINNRPRPSWICSVDGRGLGRVDAAADQHTNHWVLCDPELDGGEEHLITLNVTVPDGATFWVDEVLYAPVEDVVEGETLFIQNQDSSITYSPTGNWNLTNGIAHDTDIPDSYLTFKFRGTAATFYGILRPNFPGSTAKYSVDGGTETPFTIPAHTGVNRLFNQPLFSTAGLAPTDHTLVVTYTGRRNDTPLSLDNFIITLPPKSAPSSPSGSGSGSPGPSSSANANQKSSTPVGAIAGGVVGGLVGLALIALIMFFILRRRRRRDESPESDVTPFSHEPKPIMAADLSPRPTSLDVGSTFDPYSSTDGTSTAVRKQEQAMAAFDSEPRDVHHRDSGMRLGGPSGSRPVRDIPPEYTET